MFSKEHDSTGSFFPVLSSLTLKSKIITNHLRNHLNYCQQQYQAKIQLECGVSWSNFVLLKCTSTHHTQYIWKLFWQHLGHCHQLHIAKGAASPNRQHSGGFCPLLFQENGGQHLVTDPPDVFFLCPDVIWGALVFPIRAITICFLEQCRSYFPDPWGSCWRTCPSKIWGL